MGIETRIAKADNILFQTGSTRLLSIYSGLEPIHRTDSFSQNRLNNPNDLSIVLRLETNNKSFLFPADISAELAEKLIGERKELKADVLMAPHHGSPASMSQDFIETVAPEYIAISAGRNNPFNFPAKSFYDLQEKGIEIFSTGRDGTIIFDLENGEIMVSRYQVN